MEERYQMIPNPHTHMIVDKQTGEILLRQTYSNCLKDKWRLETLEASKDTANIKDK